MASNNRFGNYGFEKDTDKYFDFAKLAAKIGDGFGQFWLGYAYYHGKIGTVIFFLAAIKWLELQHL
jgi:hypothetical protein